MTTADYTYFLSIARHHARALGEAEDLLQNALIVALDKGRSDFENDESRKWLAGVIRNLALQDARSAIRRKERNTAYASNNKSNEPLVEPEPSQKDWATQNQILSQLSPAARKVAVLALYGMDRKEICALLNISSAAFRQRLTSIRKVLAPLSTVLRRDLLALAYARRRSRNAREGDLPIGIIRNALLKQLQVEQQQGRQALGTHDPNGHLIVITA